MKRKIDYTRKNGKKEVIECGFILYNLIRFVNWLEKKIDYER